ncbi:hypothetical protein ACOSQ3_032164 [Xanthoceras sorbifolium]
MHALWGCSSLKSVRRGCDFLCSLPSHGNVPFFNFILLCRTHLRGEQFEFLCVLFWRIWFRCNRLLHGGSQLGVEEVVKWSDLFLKDFQQANSSSPRPPAAPTQSIKWQPPPDGLVKRNINAALDRELDDWCWHGAS